MNEKTINPFNEVKRTNWAKKTQDRLNPIKQSFKENKVEKIVKRREIKEERKSENRNAQEQEQHTIKDKDANTDLEEIQLAETSKTALKKEKNIERQTKSFKIYPGKIPRDFEKRVNKLQVNFDDKGFDKNYVDSGKYLMFLMTFAEKYQLYELYEDVDLQGNIEISQKRIINHIGRVFDKKNRNMN